MKNPLREMSRPKALATAGIVAGAVAISGVAAALNVGLLTANDSAPFTPQKVAATSDGSVTTTSTTQPPVEIVYKDVYEQAPPAVVPSAPAAPSPAPVASSSDDHGSDDHPATSGSGGGASYEDDGHSESEDHESEDHESEDHESEDHASEHDGFDD